MLEEEIFYPACREVGVEHEALDEAQVEHDGVKVLVSDLMMNSVGAPFYDAKVKVLGDYVKHHVAGEERAGDGIFAKASAAGVDMSALGEGRFVSEGGGRRGYYSCRMMTTMIAIPHVAAAVAAGTAAVR